MTPYVQLGPFEASIFLVPPNVSANVATGSVLLVEQFQLLHGHAEIGFDHLHGDKRESKALLQDGLRWRGTVLFSNEARNKQQISRLGKELLAQAAEAGREPIRLDWGRGFKVILEAPYWRHCFVRNPKPPTGQDPILIELYVDLDPVLVDLPSRSTSQFYQRRFSIQSKSKTCLRHSHKTWEQSRLILVLEYIKRIKGGRIKADRRTVNWYCERYTELYPTTPSSQEFGVPVLHPERTSSRSFYSGIAMHLDSSTFCQDLVMHKRLLTAANLGRFRREVERVENGFGPEVRNRWGIWPLAESSVPQQLQDLIVIEDSPSPSNAAGGVYEPMDLDNETIDEHPVESNADSNWDYQEERELDYPPTVHQPTMAPAPSSINRSVVSGTSQAKRLNVKAARILPMIPRRMFDAPSLPADCQWVCPVQECLELFDFKGKLPRQVLEHLTPMEVEFLKSRNFTAASHKLQGIFFVLVDVHYSQHLESLGIVADNKNTFRLLS